MDHDSGNPNLRFSVSFEVTMFTDDLAAYEPNGPRIGRMPWD
jgi:hypothetical protein